MISSLAREQMRAQRAYLVWSAALIALAVGFASYGALITHTVREADAALGHALGMDTEWVGFTKVAMPSDGANADPDVTTWDDLSVALDDAVADGTRVLAWADIIELDLAGGWAVALRGDVDWDAILVEGRPPGPGEVVLPVDDASELGVSVGDVVDVRQRNGDARLSAALTVVGLAHVGAQAAGVSVMTPLAGPIVAWEDVPDLWEIATAARGEAFGYAAGAMVSWDGGAPGIERVLEQVSPGYGSDSESVTSVLWAVLGLVAVVLGLIAMAFAVGRAQAQSRSAWVATARALGASRKQVVGSTLLEAVVVGALGGVLGYVLGAVATTVHLQLIHQELPGVALPSAVTVVPWVLLGALVLGLLLATVIAGVPAFWSARVEPVVALKPETDITAAEVSRRVRFSPVVIGWVVAGTVLVLVSLMTLTTAPSIVLITSLIVFLVLTPVVANETLRWLLPPLGRWLSRRPEPAAIAAGDSVTARPRQLTVPGFVLALAMSVLIIVGSQAVFSDYVLRVDEYRIDPYAVEPVPTVPAWAFGAAVALVAVAVLIGVAISIITHNVTRSERVTREALGITPAQTRAAAGIAHGFAVGLGAVVGWGIGIVVGTAIAFAANDTSLNGMPLDVGWLVAAGFSAAMGLLLIALAGAALGGTVVGLAARAKVSA